VRQADSFAVSPRAEDRVIERCGMEGHAPDAQAGVAGVVILSLGCSVRRLG
jgi:hypothetical protein